MPTSKPVELVRLIGISFKSFPLIIRKVGIMTLTDILTLAKQGYKKSDIDAIIELTSKEKEVEDCCIEEKEDTDGLSDLENPSPTIEESPSDSSELEEEVSNLKKMNEDLKKMNEDLKKKIEDLQKSARRENLQKDEPSNSDILKNIVKSFM